MVHIVEKRLKDYLYYLRNNTNSIPKPTKVVHTLHAIGGIWYGTGMENKYNPVSLEKLRQLRTPVRNINVEHRQKINALERLAMFVTKRVGTASFFLLIFTWTVAWLGWNTLGPEPLRFVT